MSEIIGRQIECGVGVEETRGTPQGTAEKWFKKVAATVVERAEKAHDPSTRNRIEDSCGTRVVRKWIEGELNGNVHADPFGYFLYNIFGAVSSSNVTGSVYSHTFTLAQSIQHASLSLFAKDGSAQQLVYDTAMINTLSIEAAVGDYVKFTASFMAADATDNSDTPSYANTDYDFIGRDVTVKIADTEAGLSGATALEAKEISLSLDAGLIANHVLGSNTPEDIYNAKMSIEGTIRLPFTGETYKDLYLGDTYKYMSIAIVGEADIGSGNYPTLTFTLYRVQVTDWNRSDESDALSEETIAFKAFYNASDAKAIQAVLKNLTAEYDSPISA